MTTPASLGNAAKDWADKAEALASYAKMSDDDSLRKLADRIQARAVRRCGELLKQFDGRGKQTNNMGDHAISQRQAAQNAGLSKHQQDQARAVRRCGELLKQYDGKGNNQHSTGTDTTQRQATARLQYSLATTRIPS